MRRSNFTLVYRVLFDAVLVVAVLAAPWWMTLGLMAGGMMYFKYHLESVAVALLIDTLYGGGSAIVDFPVIMTALSVILFAATWFINARVRLYEA